MATLRALGVWGGRSIAKGTTSYLVTPHVAIDAGNILSSLGEEAQAIDAIFVTHSHLDHIVDIPFLIDSFFEQRREPLKIFALKETIDEIKHSIFNWKIWPDFHRIHLLESSTPAVTFHEVCYYEPLSYDGVILTPIPTNHTVPSCGYMIEKEGSAILFTSDTYTHPPLWEYINTHFLISSVIIDVSFPSRFEKLAYDSRHLTPQLLQYELKALQREITLYINHLKPNYEHEIRYELGQLSIQATLLSDGYEIQF